MHGSVLKRTPARDFFGVFFSVPVVKKALIVFHQCCMRSAASAAAAVAPIVSSFCLFPAKRRRKERLNRGILKLKSRAASVAGVMTRGCCEEENTLSFFVSGLGKKKHFGIEWGGGIKSVASYIDTQQLHENEKVCSTMQHLYERISSAGWGVLRGGAVYPILIAAF